MEPSPRIYLFTLEVVPLEVSTMYDPLPSHLTLVSRFYSHESSESISAQVSNLFTNTNGVELIFDKLSKIGPKQTAAHLIQPSEILTDLHEQLLNILGTIGVEYTQPEYMREGWKPHISKRDNDNFSPNFTHLSKSAYLIEVRKEGENHLRIIREKFNLLG